MSEHHVRIAGAGGQGAALAALLLAEAAVRGGRNATHAQAYGPESRGGASRADVIVSDGEIAYPIAGPLDVLVALTPEARARYASDLRPGGLVLMDGERERAAPRADVDQRTLPFAATARRLFGAALGANLVALGALVDLTRLVSPEAVELAIAARRPGGSAERALAAFRAGLRLASGTETEEAAAGRRSGEVVPMR